MNKISSFICITSILLMASPYSLQAATKSEASEMMQLLKQQQKQLEIQEKQLSAQKNQMKKLAEQMQKLQSKDASNNSPSSKKITRPKPIEKPKKVGVDRKPKDRSDPPKVAAIQNDGGVLLRPGKMVVEPSLTFSRSSALRVAVDGFTIAPILLIGPFEVSQVDRDTLTAAVSTRVGVMKDLEMELRVPFVYRNDGTLTRPFGAGAGSDVLTDVNGVGLGDIEIGARYQITHGEDGWPFLIGGLRFKSQTGTSPFDVPTDATTGLQTELPTGSGFYALQPTLTAIYPSDPVVLYGSMGYLYNMARDVDGGIGEIDPGDSISLSFGMGFSVNEKTSFSLGYSHNYVFKTTQNGADIPNTNELHVGAFTTGFAHRINDTTSINLNVEAGLTEDAPDVRILFRVPFSMDLF